MVVMLGVVNRIGFRSAAITQALYPSCSAYAVVVGEGLIKAECDYTVYIRVCTGYRLNMCGVATCR